MSQIIEKSAEKLKTLLRQYKKPFLVHGQSFNKLSVKSLFNNIECVHFVGFKPNPLYADVCAGVELFNNEQCDSIIAIGGGSAIDTAKCVKLFCKMKSETNFLEQEKTDTKVPLIAVPTTAGTGSESTRHAVIYFEGRKMSICHESIVPNAAILISDLLKSLSPYQKKCTLLDAACQAIESWWSVNSNEESQKYSKQALTLIKRSWSEYIATGCGKAAEDIMEASNLAGRAINITATTAPHAMSYKLTSMYGLPHGHAVALCMRHVWPYMLNRPEGCLSESSESRLISALRGISEIIDLDYFNFMLNKFDLSKPKSPNKTKDIELLSKSVNPERLKNSPVRLPYEVLKELYERIII